MHLHELTDQLNDALMRAETALDALKLGVAAELDMGNTGFLGFKKLEKTWQLVHRQHNSQDWFPLRNCSREARVRATEMLGPLLEKLRENYNSTLPEVMSAIERADTFTDEVERKVR